MRSLQVRVEVKIYCYSDLRVSIEDVKLLRSAFELEYEAIQARVLMINTTAAFSVERDLRVSDLMKSVFELKAHMHLS